MPGTPPAARRPPPAAFRRGGLVLLGYVLAAGAFTWPLALHLTTAIPGDGKDGWQETWDLWWFATALLHGTNPFHTICSSTPGGPTSISTR